MNKLKFKILMMDLSFNAIVLGTILLFGIINQKYFETLFLLASFLTLRYAFPKTYHCKTVFWCAFWSIAIFVLAIPATLPITVSLFSSVIIGMVITFILFHIEDYADICREEMLKQQPSIWMMNEKDLIDYLENNGIRDDMQKFVVMIVYDRLTYEEISKRMDYSVPTLKVWSKKCKKRLKIKSWKQDNQ